MGKDGVNLNRFFDSLQIATVPVNAGEADALVAFTSRVVGSDSSNLAVDGGHFYWTEPGPLDIRSTPK